MLGKDAVRTAQSSGSLTENAALSSPWFTCRIIKIPDCPEALCFQIRGAAPPYVHAVGRGSEAAAVGLHPGQCILKVNGNNATHGNYMEVLEHFTAYRTRQQEALGLYQWVYRTHEDAEEDRVQQAASTAYLNGSRPGSSKEDSSLEGGAELDPLQNSQQESGEDSPRGRKPRDDSQASGRKTAVEI